MGFRSILFGKKGRVNVGNVVELIKERAARFRGGRGMVLVIQEGLCLQIYLFNGRPYCSWRYVKGQFSTDRGSEAFLEGTPLKAVLKETEHDKLRAALQCVFSDCDMSVTPLWKLNPYASDYDIMRKLHKNDYGIRISFQ